MFKYIVPALPTNSHPKIQNFVERFNPLDTNVRFDACVPGGGLLVHSDNANFRPQNKAQHV